MNCLGHSPFSRSYKYSIPLIKVTNPAIHKVLPLETQKIFSTSLQVITFPSCVHSNDKIDEFTNIDERTDQITSENYIEIPMTNPHSLGITDCTHDVNCQNNLIEKKPTFHAPYYPSDNVSIIFQVIAKDNRHSLCNAEYNPRLSLIVNGWRVSVLNGPGLKGILNLGNQCYMNSGLQCLLHLPPLIWHYLVFDVKQINNKAVFGLQGQLTLAWIEVCKSMWSSNSCAITPDIFKEMIGKYNSTFSNYSQEDTYELIVSFLDGFHEEIRWPKNDDFSLGIDVVNESILSSKEALDLYQLKHNTVVSYSMHGMNKSTIQCLTCSTYYINYEAFIGLSVPIPLDNAKSNLYDCLSLYCLETTMKIDCYWFCNHCMDLREATKYILFSHLPPVLIIHLKRFNGFGKNRRKITSFVQYPMKLEISSHCIVEDSEMKDDIKLRTYSLYGVINHIGNLYSGHYTSYCKFFINDLWYNFNDEHCDRVDKLESIISENAYVLFYVRNLNQQ